MRKVVNMQISGLEKEKILKDAREHCMTISEYIYGCVKKKEKDL